MIFLQLTSPFDEHPRFWVRADAIISMHPGKLHVTATLLCVGGADGESLYATESPEEILAMIPDDGRP